MNRNSNAKFYHLKQNNKMRNILMYSVQIKINEKFIQAKAFVKFSDAKKYASDFQEFQIVRKKCITI